MKSHFPTDAEVAAGRLQALQSRDDEIARLRAALQKIVDEADGDDGLCAADYSDLARAALANN